MQMRNDYMDFEMDSQEDDARPMRTSPQLVSSSSDQIQSSSHLSTSDSHRKRIAVGGASLLPAPNLSSPSSFSSNHSSIPSRRGKLLFNEHSKPSSISTALKGKANASLCIDLTSPIVKGGSSSSQFDTDIQVIPTSKSQPNPTTASPRKVKLPKRQLSSNRSKIPTIPPIVLDDTIPSASSSRKPSVIDVDSLPSPSSRIQTRRIAQPKSKKPLPSTFDSSRSSSRSSPLIPPSSSTILPHRVIRDFKRPTTVPSNQEQPRQAPTLRSTDDLISRITQLERQSENLRAMRLARQTQSNQAAQEEPLSDEQLAQRMQQEEYRLATARNNHRDSGLDELLGEFGQEIIARRRPWNTNTAFGRRYLNSAMEMLAFGDDDDNNDFGGFGNNFPGGRSALERILGGTNGLRYNPGNYVSDDGFDTSYEALLALGERIGEAVEKKCDSQVLNSLPTFKYKREVGRRDEEDVKCTICLCEYEPGVTLKRLPCWHYFDVECIDQWLKGNNACPICRRELS